ncbi:hypothetical protein Glove_114g177 [Diversispora epigaea]|uniref:Protein kinase domain-containing protein n=1 Tax=Diversispora epigaea TaxID=1348612 RepID=A0A397J188_9GLOM|nr:hypothetical protein Glove_114g177 [Diversispora epigaea]
MSQLDEYSKEWEIWRWIDYSKFKDIEYLAKGGFGSVWKAEWIDMPEESFGFYNSNQVALKKLKNSQQISSELIVNFHCRDKYVLPIFGITQDPKTKEYAIVLRYMKNGNLIEFLQQNKKLLWKEWLWLLNSFIRELKTIHSKGFIHRDLHPGNLMITEAHNGSKFIRLGDLGLCRPVNEISSSGTYGVLPYIAPEVMNQNQYTQASDIYSVGIIMWVISTGKIPFEKELYDPELAVSIFNGHHPKIHKGTPQYFVELMEKCWHNDSSERPSAEMIFNMVEEWIRDLNETLESSLMFLNADQEMQNVDSESLCSEITRSGSHPISKPLMKHSSAIHKSKFDINNYIGKIPFEKELYDPELAVSIFNGHHPKIHKGTPQYFVELMEKCWHNDSSERPSAEMIFNMVEEWIRDLNETLESSLMFLNADQEMQNVDSESLCSEITRSGSHPISKPLMKHSSAIHKSKFDINNYIGMTNFDDL